MSYCHSTRFVDFFIPTSSDHVVRRAVQPWMQIYLQSVSSSDAEHIRTLVPRVAIFISFLFWFRGRRTLSLILVTLSKILGIAMPSVSRLSPLLVVLATFLPLAAATNCKSNEFWYKDSSCCLPSGGPKTPPTPPKGSDCPPTTHYWGQKQGCCVPRNQPPANPPTPQCPKGWDWVAAQRRCVPAPPPPPPPPTCKSSEFWYKDSGCCLPNGGPKNPPSPPKGSDCPPSTHYWGDKQGCCVPRNPPPANPPTPQCSKGWTWTSDQRKCIPTPSQPNCKSNEFWYKESSCCLPVGGPKTPPSPPKGSDCPPSTHYWGDKQGCCVPRNPPPPNCPPPQCKKQWGWIPGLRKCTPTPEPPQPPQPSPKPGNGHVYRSHGILKRSKSRSNSLCPSGLSACPIAGSLGQDYECLDVQEELESCGGCVSTGQGQDCTTIQGAWNVGCNNGSCYVHTCEFGYLRSPDNKSCIRIGN
ncbi:hypothetical protein HGRIS_007904 [Hohenbuehelia grisea]|uniref:Protein CPL1-like domain-containing protein n=1 Tax=Hohenbuehelia grisea TaxID=104357 RepID=A0ABR3J6N3_9AGAR